MYTKEKQTKLLKRVLRLQCHVNFEITFQKIHITSELVSTRFISVKGRTSLELEHQFVGFGNGISALLPLNLKWK